MYIPRQPPFQRADADSAVDVSTLSHGFEAPQPVTGTHGVHQSSDDGVSHHPKHLGDGDHASSLTQPPQPPPPSTDTQAHDRVHPPSLPPHQEIRTKSTQNWNPNPNPNPLPNTAPAQQIIHKRDTPSSNQNITIGAIVGVLLAAFLVGFFYFVYRYHRSIRVRRRNGAGAGRNSFVFTFGSGYGSSLKGSHSRSSRGSRVSSARYWHGRGPAVAGGAGGG